MAQVKLTWAEKLKRHKRCPCGGKCVRRGDHRKHACNKHNRFDIPSADSARRLARKKGN